MSRPRRTLVARTLAAVVLASGAAAIGTLSTLGLAPVPASNIGDPAKEPTFAQRHAGIDGLRLVKGTEPFEALPPP